MFIEAFISFFILLEVRKILRRGSPLPGYDKKITAAIVLVAALFIAEIFIHIEAVTMWLWHLVLFTILAIIYYDKNLAPARTIMLAVLPFAIISFLIHVFKSITGDQYASISGYLDAAILFSIVWMIGMRLSSKKQQKALEAERKKTHEEEEQKLIIAKRKAELEEIVTERTAEIRQQKEELEKTLENLKSAQAQLVQSEKMASLGELTAGIAHEIQNPLNFVNNFSEVNMELFAELKEAHTQGNEQMASQILDDIQQNLEKITHHGKRADGIVKSMLQHSRVTTGNKEPTDINALADEYLRLSYHGLRAKDKTFNVAFKTQYDDGIGTINVIGQDIGRVLLNLYTNAFYSAAEKKSLKGNGFEPMITVTTRRQTLSTGANGVEIRITDNGLGIPERLREKIFQPFFTTKPSGKGTGLGLSLSYDIITKGHGGQIKVDTREGEFATFTIWLPYLQT